MDLLHMWLKLMLRIVAVSTSIAYALPFILPENAPDWLVKHRFIYSFGTVFFLYVIDSVYIWPFFRTPLRNLPTVKEFDDGKIFIESPRGATALRWMKEFPDAELIRAHGYFNISTLVCSGPNALRDVLNTNAYDFEKAWGLRAFLSRIIGFGLVLSEGEDHKRQKRLLTPAFHIRRIRELYGLMWTKSKLLCDELEKVIKRDGPDAEGYAVVDIAEWASRLTLDIIGPTAMGRDFQSLQDESNMIAKAYLELLEPKLDRLIFFAMHWVFPEWFLRRLPLDMNRKIDELSGQLRKTCQDIVHEKKSYLANTSSFGADAKEDAGAEYDILTRIIATSSLTDIELIEQMLTFLAAGHETTASALTWACYMCAKHQDIQTALRSELRASLPPRSASTVTSDLLEGLPYLNGVCEEILRLYPTVPSTMREAIRDTVVAGTTIPKGEEILIAPYATNRHPRYWGPDADEMRPERWIDEVVMDDGRRVRRPNKTGGADTNFAELTFLHGPRACIGRDFAKAELRCIVAVVVRAFEMKLVSHDEVKMNGVITTKPAGGMKLFFRSTGDW